ncbi:MAG: hypothetical protein K8R46_00315 [Pirellulales bacterium]|nr:hypothetical protein [Pirellulales bacterium]
MNVIDFPINETILAAIIGAIIGSGLAHFLTVITESRKTTRQERRAIVTELAIICHGYIASLEEMQAAKETCDQHALRISKAQLTRLDGSLAAIQLRLWYVFPQRQVRAGLARLGSRRLETTQYLSSNTLKAKEADVAITWFNKAIEELLEQATNAADIPTRDPPRPIWIGLRKVTPEDKRLLSFEDEPPPWQFAVSFDFTRKVDLAGLEKSKHNLESRAATLRCKLHNRAAHILLYGTDTKKFDIQVETCCPEFAEIVKKAIEKHE